MRSSVPSAGVFDELARGGGAVLHHPIQVGGVLLLHLRERLAAVLALCKDGDDVALAVFGWCGGKESVHGYEVELGTQELLLRLRGLPLRLENRDGGADIRERVVGVFKVMPVVSAIDVSEAAGGAGGLYEVGIVEAAVAQLPRQPLAQQIVVEDAGIEVVAVVGEDVAALEERHHIGIDIAEGDAVRLQLLTGDMVYRLRLGGDGVGAGGAYIPVADTDLLERPCIHFHQGQLDNPIALHIQPGGLGIKTNKIRHFGS